MFFEYRGGNKLMLSMSHKLVAYSRKKFTSTMMCALVSLGLTACSRDTDEHQVPPAATSVKAAAATNASDPASRVDWAGMKNFWDRSMAMPGIDTGPVDSGKRMLIFFDANCPTCARQWQVLKPYLATVRIHWIPVAYMSATSKRRAAAILAAPDPAHALTVNEEGYDDARQLGGYVPPADIPEWALRAIETNTKALQDGSISGTPTLGLELLKGERYWRRNGMLDAKSADIAVRELGDTRDPWQRTRELSAADAHSVPDHGDSR